MYILTRKHIYAENVDLVVEKSLFSSNYLIMKRMAWLSCFLLWLIVFCHQLFLFKVISEVEKHPLTDMNRNLLYEILCALINPKRKDTRGYSLLADITEKFAFSLPIGEMCGSLGERWDFSHREYARNIPWCWSELCSPCDLGICHNSLKEYTSWLGNI